MKPAILLNTLPLSLAICSCATTQPATQHPDLAVREIYVAAQTRPCMGMRPMQCMQVRERADQPWQLFYDSILGFNFRSGTEYRLRVIEERIANPPPDSSSIRWTLDRIIEQHGVK